MHPRNILLLLLLASTGAGCRRFTRLTPAEIAQRASESVVSINVNNGQSTGTGFAVAGGYIATNLHVITAAREMTITLHAAHGNRGLAVDHYLFSADSNVDLALIHADDSPLEPLPLSDNLALGERVVAIGNPREFDRTVSDGLYSATRDFNGQQFLQVSAPTSPGSSGGPLFNERGAVVGVMSRSQTNAQNINFAIPAKSVTNLLSDHTVLVTAAELREQKDPKGGLQAQALRIRCEAGGPVACSFLGLAYYNAKDGLEKDDAAAVRFYRAGCDLGDVSGCANLGHAYLTGQGVQRDLQRGIELARASCERGAGASCFNAADAYEHGGAVGNLDRARELYQKGCDQGFEPSCEAARRLRGEHHGEATAGK